MKKVTQTICVLLGGAVALTIITICVFSLFSYKSIDINDFKNEMECFRLDDEITLSPYANAYKLKMQVYCFFENKYPESMSGRKLCAFYDEKQNLWLIAQVR